MGQDGNKKIGGERLLHPSIIFIIHIIMSANNITKLTRCVSFIPFSIGRGVAPALLLPRLPLPTLSSRR